MLSAHPLELIDAAAVGGFDYCGIRLVAPMPSDKVVNVVGNPALVREIDQRLRASGVRLLDIEAIWLQPDTDVRQLVPALETGKRLGARHVLVVGYDADEGRLFDNFCRLCQAAASLQMRVELLVARRKVADKQAMHIGSAGQLGRLPGGAVVSGGGPLAQVV